MLPKNGNDHREIVWELPPLARPRTSLSQRYGIQVVERIFGQSNGLIPILRRNVVATRKAYKCNLDGDGPKMWSVR